MGLQREAISGDLKLEETFGGWRSRGDSGKAVAAVTIWIGAYGSALWIG